MEYPYNSLTWNYQGVDFAYIPMTAERARQMYADGIRIVGRYLFNQRVPSGKGVTAAECAMYRDAGIAIFFYYEVNTDDALQGYNRGYQNGQACLLECESIGVPEGTQIYCACDTSVTDAQAAGVVMEYLRGFREALPRYRCGIYGGYNVMSACFNRFPDALRCQAGAWGASEFEHLNVRQWLLNNNRRAVNDGYLRLNGITLDVNGYAKWRGFSVDICSAPNVINMWGVGSPTPPQPTGDHFFGGIYGKGEENILVERINKIEDAPEYAKDVLKKLLNSGKLKGVNKDGDLDLSEDMCRLLTIIYRE